MLLIHLSIIVFLAERTMEDHEGILGIYKRWSHATNNRFHFRKDFRKYEIFQNPGVSCAVNIPSCVVILSVLE